MRLWEAVNTALSLRDTASLTDTSPNSHPIPRYGEPTLVTPRLGQGAFRVLVTDVYHRRCAITGGKTLPALDAAHIRPYKAKVASTLQVMAFCYGEMFTAYLTQATLR